MFWRCWYKSPPLPLAVVYFFQANVIFMIDDAKFWHILARFGQYWRAILWNIYALHICKLSMPFSRVCPIPSSSCAMLSFTPDSIYQPDVIRGEGRHMLIGGWAWFLLLNPSDWRILFPFVLKELELVKMHTAPQSIFLNKYLREFELKSFAWIGEAWKSGQMEMWKYGKSKIWDEANIRKWQRAYIIQ